MAGMSGSMTWDLIANSTKYVAGMSKARAATDQMSKAAQKARRQTELLGRAAGIAGVAVAAAFTKKIVGAASELNETMSKSSVVFGKAAGSVQKWSTTSAKAFGMSQNAALGAAATYGNLFVSMGLAEESAADMSMQLVELAGDLASFNNVSPTEALDALRSGLVGETEPLRRFGVNLSDAELRLKALNMGLVDSTKSVLPPAIKSQAAYALILEQTATAQGDYERTADGLANSQRTLTAQWEDLQAKLGEGVLPAANGVVGAMNNLLGVANAAPPAVRNTALAAAAASVAFLALAPRIAATKAAMADLPRASAAASKGMKGLAAAVAAFTAATLAVRALGDSSVNSGLTNLEGTLVRIAQTGKGMEDLGYTLSLFGEDVYGITDAIARSQMPDWWDSLTAGISDLAGADSRLRLSEQAVADLDAALASMVQNGMGGQAFDVVERLKDELEAQGQSADLLSAKSLPNYRSALDGVTKSQADVGDAASDATGEVETFADAIEKLNSPTRDLAQAQMDLIENARDMATSLKDNGKSFDMSTEAGAKNLSQLLDTIEGIEEYGAAVEAKGGNARAAVMKERDALIANIAALTGNEKKAKALVDRYLKIPPAADAAASSVDEVTAALNRMPTTKTVTITVKGKNMRLIGAEALATGGPVTGPGSGTSDSVPIMASNGEWVMSAASVKKYGPDFMAAVNSGRVKAFADGGLVDTGFASAGSGSSSGGSSTRRRRRRSSSSTAKTWDRGLRDSIMGANSLFDGFDMDAWANATDRVTDATEALADARKSLVDAEADVADARRAVNQAGSPEDQARAERQLADALAARAAAQGDVAAATTEQANAEKARLGTKLTSDNVVAGFRKRAQKLARFKRDIVTLQKRGLSRAIISEILEAGIDEGGAMAAALVAGNDIGDLNKIYGSIASSSRMLAQQGMLTDAAGTSSGGSSGGGTSGTTGSSGTVTLSFENASRPVVLKVDSEQVWKGLLKLKKAKGGAALGLS